MVFKVFKIEIYLNEKFSVISMEDEFIDDDEEQLEKENLEKDELELLHSIRNGNEEDEE
jgi:hypothetical protein